MIISPLQVWAMIGEVFYTYICSNLAPPPPLCYMCKPTLVPSIRWLFSILNWIRKYKPKNVEQNNGQKRLSSEWITNSSSYIHNLELMIITSSL